MNPTDRASSQLIVTATEAAGLAAPKAIREAFTKAQQLNAAANTLGDSPQSTAQAVYEALVNGLDPASDPTVQRAIAAEALTSQGRIDSVQFLIMNELRQVCTDNAADLVAVWRKEFDKAAATLEEAYARIGDLPLEDTATIMRKGGDVADVWAAARKAVNAIDQITTAWVALCMFTNLAQPQHPRQYRPLRLAELDYPTLVDAGPDATPWTLVVAGHSLSLPTPEEYKARVHQIEQERSAPVMVVDEQRSAISGRVIRVPA